MAAQVTAASRGKVGEEFSDSDGDLSSDHFSSEEDEKNCDPLAEPGEESTALNPNAGWADAMSRILNKNLPGDKPIILAKNKEKKKEKEKRKQELSERMKKLDERKEREQMCRVKPDLVRDREIERNLQRIATKGVVQLFNAVRKHQTVVDEKVKEVGGSERKRAKLMSTVSKKDFISVLRGSSQAAQQDSAEKTPNSEKQVVVKSEEVAAWNILRDDFMMGATMKDWDKESDVAGEESASDR
ncbi:RRP15-like protein [Mobula hypostoma]|uniref:RRP15-like protein n=1 Tax=Mobula hypostoma TaxID=723540 RepID=UPI002FC3472D